MIQVASLYVSRTDVLLKCQEETSNDCRPRKWRTKKRKKLNDFFFWHVSCSWGGVAFWVCLVNRQWSDEARLHMWLDHKPFREFPGRLSDKHPHLIAIPILPLTHEVDSPPTPSVAHLFSASICWSLLQTAGICHWPSLFPCPSLRWSTSWPTWPTTPSSPSTQS